MKIGTFFASGKDGDKGAIGNRMSLPARAACSALAMLISSAAFAANDPAAASKAADTKPVKEKECYAAKEFITTLNYLRDKKDLGLPEQEARRIAKEVSMSCEGAAGRFIDAIELLMKAGVSGRDAVQQGAELAKAEQSRALMYLAVFKEAFVEEGYDLDLASSIKLARRLTFEYEGDLEVARDDFSKFSRFCVGRKGLDLPKADCAEFSAKFTLTANRLGIPVYPLFEKGFDFLKSSEGPNLTTGAALKLLEALLSKDKYSVDNFRTGYRYAVSSKGLSLPADQAIAFAKELALRPGK